VIGPVDIGVAVAVVPVTVELVTVGIGAELFSWYILSLLGPPQYSVELPWQSILQPFVRGLLLAWRAAPFEMELPQKH
jgi:hypothetical protein